MQIKLGRAALILGWMALVLGPLVPTLVPVALTAHDLTRAVQLPLLLLAALALVFQSAAAPRLHPWAMAQSVLLIVLVGLSAANAAIPGVAWREVALFAGLIGWSIWIAGQSGGERLAPWMGVVCLSQLLYGLMFMGLLVAALAGQQPVLLWEMSLGYDNPRFLNHVQTVVLPLLLGIAAQPSATRRTRLMAIVALTLQLFLLLSTLGRSTMVSVVVGAGVVMLVVGAASRRWIGLGLATTAVALVAYLALQSGVVPVQQAVGYRPTAKELTSDHSRQYLWNIAISDSHRSPWLGVGPMHFAHEVNEKGAHPHNHYLQMAAELGWPATLAVVALMLRGLSAMARALRAEHNADRRAIGCGLLGAGVAAAVDACFSGNLVMPISQIWIFTLIGLSFGWYEGRSRPNAAKPLAGATISPNVWLAARAVLVMAAFWSCVAASKEISASTPHLQAEGCREPSPQDVSRPRYWSYGWF
jgi:O-antigen ligase